MTAVARQPRACAEPLAFPQLCWQVARSLELVSEGPYAASVSCAIDVVERALRRGGKLLIFGNGGSFADAQHIAAEFVGQFARVRPPLAAIALTTNQAVLTAWSNDVAFEDVFAREIEALGRPGDVAWGISTSGASRNVVKALERARALGLATVGLTGSGGGQVGAYCDVLMAVPLTDTPRVQELHLVTYHAICAAVEHRLLAPPS
jgi:D-sedoheptulose 7-phosphate isomerase